MWAIAGILGAAGILIGMEVPALLRKKQYKELLTFSVLLLLATAASVAKTLRLPVPNPLEGISYVFKPASDALFSWLK